MEGLSRFQKHDAALKIWSKLERINLFSPATVSVALDVCGFGAKPQYALELWERLKQRQFPLDANNYNSLIECLLRNNCIDDAKRIFYEFVDSPLQPDQKTYLTLLHPLLKSRRFVDLQEIKAVFMRRYPQVLAAVNASRGLVRYDRAKARNRGRRATITTPSVTNVNKSDQWASTSSSSTTTTDGNS
jgi:pentatricopeptide repeat protein